LERRKGIDLSNYDLMERLKDLYVTYRGRYVRSGGVRQGYYIPKMGNEYSKLNDAVLLGHMNKEYSVCVFSGEKITKFVCFDVDREPKVNTPLVIRALKKAGVDDGHIVVSFSGSKGYHVELFFEEPMKVDSLRMIYYFLLEETGLSAFDVEFRPTITQAIKLPLSLHPRTGNVCWYCNPHTLEVIENPEYIFTIMRLPVAKVQQIIDALPSKVKSKIKDDEDTAAPGQEFSYSELMTDKIPILTCAGERHKTMLSVGLYAARSGLDEQGILTFIINWWEVQDPSLSGSSQGELISDIKAIARWSSKFVFNEGVYKRTDEMMSKEDVLLILEQKERLRRKVLFLLMALSSKRGYYMITYERIRMSIGASNKGVINAIKSLKDEGYVASSSGRVNTREGRFKRDSNRYQVMQKPTITMHDITVNADIVENQFSKVYFGTLEIALGET
jgi:hypothetical protein